jgi:quercetin dioxygenase-like cupin family protein
MTNFAVKNLEPGKDLLPRAPVQKVTRLQEQKSIEIGTVSGNPQDQGVYWTLIARYLNGAEEFDFGVYRLQQDQYHPRHYHPAQAEFYYILEGSCVVRIDEDDIEAGPGTALYMPPGTIHAVRTRSGETVTMVYGFSCGDFREAGVVWTE